MQNGTKELIIEKSNEEKFDAIIKATEKSRAIVKAVDELLGVVDPNRLVSALDDVLIDWLSSTGADKEYREMIYSYFFAIKIFLNDLEMIED
jgi:hypothetical protein